MSSKYWKVFWSRDVKKKKKVFSDGVVHMTDAKVRLYGGESELIHEGSIKQVYYHNPDNQDEFLIGSSIYVSIDCEVTKESFMSGTVFMPAPIPKNPKKKQQINNKNVKEETKSPEERGFELGLGYFIESFLYNILRPHQVQGVRFMFECLAGLKGENVTGCILADYMGLGKTLQTLSLLYVLLRKGGKETNNDCPFKKAIVVSPLTLVDVWHKETQKWFGDKLLPIVALGADGKEVTEKCKTFAKDSYRLLLISYESFVSNADHLNNRCDVIIFDEGHRLKNRKCKSFKVISGFSCKKRVLLTGTPLQNSIEEFYTCISLVNPFLFPSETLFKNIFQKPILDGMKKNVTEAELALALQRSRELTNRVKIFSLRRRADVLQKLLPPKKEYHVFLGLTEFQQKWYSQLVKNYEKKLHEVAGDENPILSLINKLRKLFTHPKIFKASEQNDHAMFPQSPEVDSSSKYLFTRNIVRNCMQDGEKLVIVSYFTESIDFIADTLTMDLGVKCGKLDGSMSADKRRENIVKFQKDKDMVVFLLSAKAGGTGLNLTCANKMIMFEPDWNPSNDHQVMGRVWRDGQTKPVHIYRLITIGTIEERILQRQYLKQSLSEKLVDESKNNRLFDFSQLRNLIMKRSSTNECLTYKGHENRLSQILAEGNEDFQPQGQKERTENGIKSYVEFVYIRKQKNTLNGVNEFEDGEAFVRINADGEESTEEEGEMDEDSRGEKAGRANLYQESTREEGVQDQDCGPANKNKKIIKIKKAKITADSISNQPNKKETKQLVSNYQEEEMRPVAQVAQNPVPLVSSISEAHQETVTAVSSSQDTITVKTSNGKIFKNPLLKKLKNHPPPNNN